MDTLKFKQEELMFMSKIHSIDELKKVLDTMIRDYSESIHTLATSTDPAKNYERLTLIGKRDLAINLLSRLAKD